MPRRHRSRTTRLGTLAFTVGLVAVSSAVASQTIHRGVPRSDRGSREHQAQLELYALDSRLRASRDRVAYLASGAAKLRRERRALRSELREARATLATAQRRLALQVRTLYEQGEVDPLAVVLGASSLRSGLQELDDLNRMAAASTRIVAATRAAENRLLLTRQTLASGAAADPLTRVRKPA